MEFTAQQSKKNNQLISTIQLITPKMLIFNHLQIEIRQISPF